MWNSALSPIIAAPIEHRLMTRPFIFKCPITNQHVQGWLEDEDAQITEFEGMTCPACMRLHFLNRRPASCWELALRFGSAQFLTTEAAELRLSVFTG
jgi:hypothetical protein